VSVKPTFLNHLWARLRGRSEVITGYRVEAQRAVDILAASNPEAAQWWRQNTPGLLQAGRLFMFHAEACQTDGPDEDDLDWLRN